MSTVLRILWCGIRQVDIHTLLWVTLLVTRGAAGHLLPQREGHAAGARAPAGPASAEPEPQHLAGRWDRPDGGYILELREAMKDGNLNAGYFNPRPINVAKAEWRRKGGKLTVFVELRDVNYAGSTYTLQYDPASDRLKGTYFQAVAKETYKSEFERR
jgi:hypothetical protein